MGIEILDFFLDESYNERNGCGEKVKFEREKWSGCAR